MSENNLFSRVLAVTILVWLTAIGIPLFFWIATGASLWWLVAGLVAAIIYSSAVLPPYFIAFATKDKKPTHERISVIQRWDCPLSPAEAVDSIYKAFQGEGSVVSLDERSVDLSFGSDLTFRKWGIFVERGRQALPTRLIVSAVPASAGSQITAEARDDLGWYLTPLGQRVKTEAANTSRYLLKVAIKATQSSSQSSR